ncbi:MAG: SPFH domain-containing protein [Anaerolineae bacterium]|nr:SPFH domain-containing protein [Anaerolineae bacterium]MDQ7036318.1 SPFH domain-containing protein [Anaerolineae bacterium]
MLLPWIYFIQVDEQLLIESFTQRRVINGAGRYIARPLEKVTRRDGVRLNPTQYAHLENTLTGELRNIWGPQLYFLTAYESVVEITEAASLKENQYAYILNNETGEIRMIRGPQLYFPEANEVIVTTQNAIPLKEFQYIRLLDSSSGKMRVVRGETSVYLEPHEQIVGSRTDEGINIDEKTAVIVRDTTTGQQTLVTEKQVFIPAANQELVEVRQRIRLEDHETVIIKDKDGRYIFKNGSDDERSFFLEPYHELLTLRWASGLHKDARELYITHIDIRPKYMWYEFEVRTKDNVELVIGITFFWKIVDVPTMIKMTDDTPGDVCSHARSTIIQAVSKVTLEGFLDNFNNIVRTAALGDDEIVFYSERGVQINAVEVRSVTCKDPETQAILMEIIQETTNRLNRLQKQESENEVWLKKLQGKTESETARGALLTIKRDHAKLEALTEGEAEAERVKQFLDGLGDAMTMEQKVSIFNTLRKRDMLNALSQGSASVYFTPADVNLSIETST